MHGYFIVLIWNLSALTSQALPFSVGFLAPWDLWVMKSGPGLLRSLCESCCFLHICQIKAQFLTSLSPCVYIHHCSCPRILHTGGSISISVITSREALRFNKSPFSLAWEVHNSIDDSVCWSIPWITNYSVNNCTWIDFLNVHEVLSLKESRLLII